jgi:hypothetical protein
MEDNRVILNGVPPFRLPNAHAAEAVCMASNSITITVRGNFRYDFNDDEVLFELSTDQAREFATSLGIALEDALKKAR